MDNILVFTGIVMVGLALWKDRLRDIKRQKELQESIGIRDELLKVRKEGAVLLEQLEVASEKIVEEVSSGLEQIKWAKKEKNDYQSPFEGSISGNFGTPVENTIVKSTKEINLLNDFNPIEINQVTQKKSKNRTIMFPPNKGISEKNEKQGDRDLSENRIPAKHQMVYAMARLGYSVDEIARQMKIGKGEVNLMLQLKRKGEEGNV